MNPDSYSPTGQRGVSSSTANGWGDALIQVEAKDHADRVAHDIEGVVPTRQPMLALSYFKCRAACEHEPRNLSRTKPSCLAQPFRVLPYGCVEKDRAKEISPITDEKPTLHSEEDGAPRRQDSDEARTVEEDTQLGHAFGGRSHLASLIDISVRAGGLVVTFFAPSRPTLYPPVAVGGPPNYLSTLAHSLGLVTCFSRLASRSSQRRDMRSR